MDNLKQLEQRVSTLETLLSNSKRVLTLEEASVLTGHSKQALYKKTSTRKIPHYKPGGGKIFFDREELEKWMRSGRVATMDEIQDEVNGIPTSTN
jgi:excisionase family DNA binding protein